MAEKKWERRFYNAGKRALDLVVAVPALVLVSPLIALAALAVRIKLGSPVFFRQVRAGQYGEPMQIIKLRSMTNARGLYGELLPDSHRLTRLGLLLRKTSIDELPNLWSVVKGDLSLVGPRPLPMSYVARYNDEQRRRLDVKPGITGWAQVNGRNQLEWEERFALDVWYVDHASLVRDLQILALTARALVDVESVTAPGHATMPEFERAA